MPPNDRSSRPPPNLGQVRPDRTGHAPQPPRLHAGYSQPRTDGRSRLPPPTLRREPPRSRGLGIGRLALYGLVGVLGLIAIGVGVLVMAPPADLVRQRMVAEVERQTGRKLSIGSATVSFTSGLGVALTDVVLSAPPGMAGRPLLAAQRIEVSLALLPLVLREVKVDRLTLVKPMLDLRVDGEGRRSWDFAGLGGPLRYAQVGGRTNDAERLPPELRDFARNASPPGATGNARLGIEGLSLADVRISDGRLRYDDPKAGVVREVRGIEATLSLPTIGGPLTVKGQLVLAGETIAVDARLDQMRELLAERPVGARILLGGKAIDATYDGKLTAGALPGGEGRFAIKVASPAALARALEVSVQGLEALGAVSIEGLLKSSPGSHTLSNASFSAGRTSGTGSLGVDTSAERPKVAANLRLAVLDLDQIMAVTQGRASAADGSAARFAAPPAAAPASPDAPAGSPAIGPPRSIDDLIERQDASPPAGNPATRVRGFRKRAGNQWEVEAIDATPLRLIDADARLQIAALKSEKLAASNVQAAVDLKGGLLRLSVTDGQLSGGVVRGLVSIDARQPSLTIGANLSGDSVALKPVLEAAGIDLLDGRGRAIVAVSAQGGSERELVSTLGGRADIRITEGSLIGWDADAMVAGLTRGQMPQAHRQPGARTPFKELSATFQIAQGVARTRDLKLDSNSVQAAGTGTINIVDRNIDLLLKPKLAATGLEVPVRIAGPWDDPSAVADVAGALKSPQAQEAVRQLKDGNVDGALRSVLGNDPKAEEKIGKAKEVLRGLLGR